MKLWHVAAALIALDWATTSIFLHLGYTEGNPLFAAVLQHGALAHVAFRAAEVALIAVYAHRAPRATLGLLFIVGAVSLAVSWNLAGLLRPWPVLGLLVSLGFLAAILTTTALTLRGERVAS